MTAPPLASVIVRAKDKQDTIERALSSLRAQTVQPEIIVVDSGSRDRTREIARRYCDQLIDLPPDLFTYGHALNVGARAASAPVHFALSAHCFTDRDDWIERALAHYQRPEVAATHGARWDCEGRPITHSFHQDLAQARANPFWGFSNHASSWRASVWESFPFDETIVYAEDKEWAWRVLEAGHVIAIDPELSVGLTHQWRSGVGEWYRRQRRTVEALSSFAPLPPYGTRELLREWWSQFPDGRRSPLVQRLNYRRMAGLAGKYAGYRLTRRATTQ